MTLKIKKITIENFRGIRLPIEVNFVKGNNLTSALVYGRNGTGKSSIVDAWEWLNNNFEISTLNREGVSLSDIPHKASNGNNCYIAVEFQHPTINSVQATFNNKKFKAPVITGEYDQFKNLSTYPNYLRYADLQDFVYKRKADRYKYIAKFFGLEKFSHLQDTLQTVINKQALNLQNHRVNLIKDIELLNTITNSTVVDEDVVLKFINSIAVKYKLNSITQFKDADAVRTALEEIVNNNPVAKELAEWRAFQTKLNKFYPIGSAKTNCLALEKLFTDLKKDEESIKQLILSQLYEISIDVIPKLDDKSKCPVCDKGFEGDLLQHIRDKHSTLDVLNKKKTEFDSTKANLEREFESLARKIAAIQSESSISILSVMRGFFDDLNIINAALPSIRATLNNQLKDISILNISSDPAVERIDNIIKNESTNKKIVSDNITALSNDEKTRTLAQDYTNIINLIIGYKNYLINFEKVNYLTNLNTNLDFFFSHITSFIQTEIQTTFSTISNDVVECFNILESSNRYIKNPALKLISDKDKAIELEIEFVSEKIIPAFKFLSESQVNSFGLAIFLSAVKHFNNEFKFFILDDVISSFDSFKRPKVSELIATKFNDFQILLLTHDQIFFDTVQKNFPEWQRYKFTNWDYTTGPKCKPSNNYFEEIQSYIDEDDPIKAGQTLGRYLEWIYGIVSENMEVPIKYKIENVYTLSEFYAPLAKRFKDKLKLANKQHKLVPLLDEFETIFRNYCMHWKNEATQFSTSEIKAVFDKWREIEQLIYCSSCKSFISYEKINSDEYVRCNCSKLNLKDNSFYLNM